MLFCSDSLPMKSSWVRGLLIFSLIFSLALKQNDVVELEQYFNARYSANFLKTTKNVKFVMPPGTQGKIEEIKNFSSGNRGLQVTLQNGKNKGEKVWVYYKPSDPGMKLYTGETEKSETTEVVEEAKSVVTTEKTPAWRVPAQEAIKEYAEDLLKKLDTVQEKIKVVETKNQKPCDDDCKLAQQTYMRDLPKPEEKPEAPREPVKAAGVREEKAPRVAKPATPPKILTEDKELPKASADFVPATQQDAPLMRAIPNTENRSDIEYTVCRYAKNGTYSLCSVAAKAPTRINIRNDGPNKAVPRKGANFNREWNFESPGLARQDIGFRITDDRTGTNSALQESYIMVFPRQTLPTIRVEGNKQIVTLANGETVTFDKRNNEIIGGVFKENGPIAARPANISYAGKGVMIRADAQGKDARSGKLATVTKQGKTCSVPKAELWNRSEHKETKFKFFSDKDLDAYLKRKCGFGVY